jgi:hypothetical protein
MGAKGAQHTAGDVFNPDLSPIRRLYDPTALSPTELATKAWRPRNSIANWDDKVARALPAMRRSVDANGIDVNKMTVDDALDMADDAALEKWREYKRNYLGPNADVTINTQPVADAMRKTIDNAMREQDPALAQEIERVASTFDKREMSIDEVQQRVTGLNNATRAIEAKFPADKRAAKLDPANAYKFAQRDTLRSLMDQQLERLSGPGAAELRKDFGALRSVQDVIQRRTNVANRAAPEALSAILAKAYAASHIVGGVLGGHPLGALTGVASLAAEHRARMLNDPDFLTQQAMKKTQPAQPWMPTTPEGPRAPTTAQQVEVNAGRGPQALPPGQYNMPPSPLGPVMQQRQFQLGTGAESPISSPARMLPGATLESGYPGENPALELPTEPSASAEQARRLRLLQQGRGMVSPTTPAERPQAGTQTQAQGIEPPDLSPTGQGLEAKQLYEWWDTEGRNRVERTMDAARAMKTAVDEGGPNQPAHLQLDDNARQLLGDLGLGRDWMGINWHSSQGREISNGLRGYADRLDAADRTQEAQNIRTLADQTDRVNQLNADPTGGHAGVPMVHRPEVISHETTVHGGQRALDPEGEVDNFTDIQRTASHPALQSPEAQAKLEQIGAKSLPHQVVELQAHTLDGNYGAFGLSKADAVSFIQHSLDVLAEHHGDDVMQNLPRLSQGYVQAMRDFVGGENAGAETAGAATQRPAAGADIGEAGRAVETPETRAGPTGGAAGAGSEVAPGALEARPLKRKGEAEREHEGGTVFASPNVSNLGSAAEARTRIGGAAHQSFRNMVDQLHQGLGLAPTTDNSTGIWSDGAENSVMSNHATATADQLRYTAALQGKWGNQKSALWFHYNPDGADTHFSFTVEKGTMQDSPEIISQRLRNAGVPFSNITKVKGGWRVDVVDLGNQLHDNVEEAAKRFGVPEVKRYGGEGGYIGGDPNIADDSAARADAQKAYAQVIGEAESRNPQWGQVRDGIEAGGDYNRLRRSLALAQEKGPLIPAEHLSPEGDLTRATQFSTQPTGDQPEGQYKYRAALNREDYYDVRQDPEQLFSQAKNQNELERLAKQAGYKGLYDSANSSVTDFKGAAVSPDFIPQRIKDLFEPDVLAQLHTPGRQQNFLDALGNFEGKDNLQQWVAAAQQGVSGQKWYQRSGEAFDALNEVAPDVFRPEDKKKFVDLVAALSPQQSVPENLAMALESWSRWMKGDPKRGIAPRSTRIDDLRKTVNVGTVDMEARLQNAHRALTGEELSGQKVSDFTNALLGNFKKAVIDRIMGTFAGVDTRNRSLTKEEYLALSAMTKQAAKEMGWEPSEAQAAIWVWTEALLQKTGLRQGAGEEGAAPRLTAAPEDVALSSPDEIAKASASRDFMDIMRHSEKVRALLRRNGVDLEELDRSLATREAREPKPAGKGAVHPEALRAAARRIAETRLGGAIPPEWRGSPTP